MKMAHPKRACLHFRPKYQQLMMVAGARFVPSRHLNETGDQPLGFVFVLPRVNPTVDILRQHPLPCSKLGVSFGCD